MSVYTLKKCLVMFIVCLCLTSSIKTAHLRQASNSVTSISQTKASSTAENGNATTIATSGATANNSEVIIKDSNGINNYLTNTQLTNVLKF